MKPDIYRQLQRHLDRMPVPFPETESGVEISLLKQLFDQKEAYIALQLSAIPETVDRIHRRLKDGEITKELLSTKLKELFDKGAIMSVPHAKKGPMYSKLPLAIGIFEHQVNRITKELAEDFFKYEDEGFAEALLTSKTKQMRTIPVNISIDPEFLVGSYDNARSLIERSPGPFAVMNCVCRQAKEQMGEPCKQTSVLETCFTLEKAAVFMVGKGLAREVDRDEMHHLVERAEVLRDFCIGCGVCLKVCPTGAISLIKKEKEVVPPKDSKEMLMERYGVLGTLKFMGKAVLGKKI